MRDRGWLQDGSPGTRRESSGSSLLQERLKEKKVARLSERQQYADIDVSPDGTGTKGSPQIGAGNRAGKDRDGRPSSSGGRLLPLGKKGMGIKEMEDVSAYLLPYIIRLLTPDQSVSTLHKQNFDLKLELFHRRQRQTELEERLEAAEAQVAEQAEMQAVNEQLLAELEKRDQAVEEAVGIICALEEKIDKLMKEQNMVRSYDAQDESNYLHRSNERGSQRNQDKESSPLQRNGMGNAAPNKPSQLSVASKSVGRMPSFLSEQSEGAEALRSLYLGNDHHSHLSPPKLSEENNGREEPEEVDGMDSPRLSVLSESSFLSVYGDKGLAIDALDLNDGADMASPIIQRHRKSISIEKWVDERAKAAKTTPRRSSASPTRRNDQYPSILNVLESPLQRLEKMERKISRHNASVRLFSQQTNADVRTDGSRHDTPAERESMRKTEMTTFGHIQDLPPTPDTISTNTLRRFKNSNDTLGRGAAEEDQELDIGRLHRMSNAPSYSSASNIRPHSAGETVTSRREGHGWDTVTQSEVTEMNSDLDVELPSTFDPWIAMGREKRRPRIQPPDMFTFGGEDEEEWGRDMMFNRDDGSRLPRLRDEYRSNREEEPRSEDTITASSRTGRPTSTCQSTLDTVPTTGLGIQSSPEPPQRRSSLAHSPAGRDKKYRKPSLSAQPSLSYHNAVQASISTTVYADPLQNNTKRSRITSRLFSLGRSEQPPSSTAPGAAKASAAAPNLTAIRSYTDYVTQPRGKRSSIDLGVGIDGLHSSSATPPPIARYPKTRASVGPGAPRPMSASSLDSNVPGKSVSGQRYTREYDDGFGVDGARDERSGVGNGKGDGKAQGRKWFGLGRTGSVRR